ncbi:MAG: LPXTG cell wall anchor domain-containing protein, partial [Tissierellia bacterium]|nr:LPXTG cell wall anchor domain-containing protein [Tissierellia bacterium]
EQKVVIEDMIPEFTSYVEDSATNGGIYKDGKLTWTKEKLADGEIFEVTFKVKVEKAAAGETLTNEALVRAGKNELKTNETHNPTEPNIPEDGTPKTGDNTSIKLFVLMIVISGTALVAISGLKKKKEYQK